MVVPVSCPGEPLTLLLLLLIFKHLFVLIVVHDLQLNVLTADDLIDLTVGIHELLAEFEDILVFRIAT